MEERVEPHIQSVTVLSTVVKRKSPLNERERRKDRDRRGENADEAAKHAGDLRGAAESANGKLLARNSPYRFYVCEEDGEVYLNLVILDETGGIRETRARNITHEEFSEWLNHLEKGEGILLDTMG